MANLIHHLIAARRRLGELGADFDPRRNVVSLWYHFAPWLDTEEKIRKPNSPFAFRGPFASERGGAKNTRGRIRENASTTEGTDLHVEKTRTGTASVGANAFEHGQLAMERNAAMKGPRASSVEI